MSCNASLDDRHLEGRRQPGPKFDYKLAWMERLLAHAQELYAAGVPVVLAGEHPVQPAQSDQH
jgi:exodeoxyribonuclease-3